MSARGKGKGRQLQKVVKLDSLKQINLHAAGLDIGSEEIWVCVPEGRAEQSVRCFESFTVDLYALADWLEACGIETVAMESTGVYWIPIYEILEGRGFQVNLISARTIKNVPGRKSDILDCQWIQQLHTYGLLQASFRPDEEMCALRAYTRHRENLVRLRSSHGQHMQKAMQQMNLQLANVLSDITGETGMQIMRAIVAGEHDPITLARFRDPRCRSSESQIAKSLTGNYRPEHLFALRQALELYDFYTQQIKACDVEIEQKYAAMKPVVDIDDHPLPPAQGRRRSKNEPDFDLRTHLYRITGVDLTRITGLNAVTVHQILTTTGTDMTPWRTVKHFSSWLTLAPNVDVSGGKVLRKGTRKSNNRAAQAFRMAAQSAGRTNTAIGAFYRRMRAKHGAPKAITATAHKLARIFYTLLKNRQEFREPGQHYYETQYQQRAIKNLQRKAKQLGMKLVPLPDVS